MQLMLLAVMLASCTPQIVVDGKYVDFAEYKKQLDATYGVK